MIVSRYIHSLRLDANCSVMWHSVFGRPIVYPEDFAKYLLEAQQQTTEFDCLAMNKKFDLDDEYAASLISELIDAYVLVDSDEKEEQEINALFVKHNKPNANKVKSLSLIMSEECNFRCKYCIHFANSNHRYNPEKFMKVDVAKKAIDDYLKIAVSNHLDEAYINFGGGEPLLNWKTISILLDYIEEYRKNFPIPIRLGINTNISLITEEIARKLIQHDVEIAASLDGFKKGNDSVRLSKNLEGTYDSIIKGFRLLHDFGHPLNGFAMTVTEDNFCDVSKELIDWAISLNMTEVRIDIDVVGLVNLPIEEVAERLIEVRTYAKKHNVSVIGFWSRAAENMGLIPEEEDIGFCGGERGNSLCVAPSGQVFPCGYSNYELCKSSDILNIASSEAYKKLLTKRNLLRLDKCKKCPIYGFCRGGCLITQEANRNSENGKIDKMCQLYTSMTYAILHESADMDFA